MFRAWMQRWWINKWVLLITSHNVWCFQIRKTAEGKLQFQSKKVITTSFVAENAVDELKQILPRRSGLIICLPSELVLLKSFALDPKLSRVEKRLFIQSHLSKSMKSTYEDVAFVSEKLAATSSGRHSQLVAAVDKKYLTPLSKLIIEHQCSCVRLEGMQVTIAWWANKQRTKNKSRY